MHRVTLTFDNGPSAEVTPFVLDQLASRDLSAWFCVVGRQLGLDGGKETIPRITGHPSVNYQPPTMLEAR